MSNTNRETNLLARSEDPTDSQLIRIEGSLGDFAGALNQLQLDLEVVPLKPGLPRGEVRMRKVGEGIVTSYRTEAPIGALWRPLRRHLNIAFPSETTRLVHTGAQPRTNEVVCFLSLDDSLWGARLESTSSFIQLPEVNLSIPESIIAELVEVSDEPTLWSLSLPGPLRIAMRDWLVRVVTAPHRSRGRLESELEDWYEVLRVHGRFEDRRMVHPYSMLAAEVATHFDKKGGATSLPEIAKFFGVAPRRIQRAFMQVFGVGVIEFLRNRQLLRVRSALASSDAPIGEVAKKGGLLHASRFARDFRELFGETPTEMRRRLQRGSY